VKGMVYLPDQRDRRKSARLKRPFSFHLNGDVLKGRDISEVGISVYCPNAGKSGLFYFRSGQKLKDCSIQIEGQTFYFTRLRVARLEEDGDLLLYGIEIDHMLEPEKQRFHAFYTNLYEQSSKTELL
jgi:hypothetical protein